MDHVFTVDLASMPPAEVEVFTSLRPTVQVSASNLDDEQYIRLRWLLRRHEALDLDDPRTISEKLQWLKLRGRDPRMPGLVDKLAVRDYVAERIGAAYLNELYYSGDSLDGVELSTLPDRFIVKCTHGSQWNIAVPDRRTVDWAAVRERIDSWLSINYYELWREWVYAEIPPRVTVERLLKDPGPLGLCDYKVFCCNGTARFVQLDIKPAHGERLRNVYDSSWRQLPCTIHRYANSDFDVSPPPNLDRMLELAETLAGDFPFVRVDFFIVAGDIVFGEMTFFPGNGLIWIRPAEYDRLMGDQITLPGPVDG
jgi:hypothetical protein